MNKTPSKNVAGLLAILFGSLGVHQFYLRKYNVGIVWLLLFLVFCWTFAVPVVLAGLGVLQGIYYLSYNDENWEKAYGQAK